MITFILFKCGRLTDNSTDFYLCLVMKKLMITKNLVVKTQNLVVNHESQPLKSNPKSILVTTDIVIIEMF